MSLQISRCVREDVVVRAAGLVPSEIGPRWSGAGLVALLLLATSLGPGCSKQAGNNGAVIGPNGGTVLADAHCRSVQASGN